MFLCLWLVKGYQNSKEIKRITHKRCEQDTKLMKEPNTNLHIKQIQGGGLMLLRFARSGPVLETMAEGVKTK